MWCWYWVNPGRSEMHSALAMTAAQALGAACVVEGSLMQQVMARPPEPLEDGRLEFDFAHANGTTPVGITTVPVDDVQRFPFGEPNGASYVTTVLPLAEGRGLVKGA